MTTPEKSKYTLTCKNKYQGLLAGTKTQLYVKSSTSSHITMDIVQ